MYWLCIDRNDRITMRPLFLNNNKTQDQIMKMTGLIMKLTTERNLLDLVYDE